MRRLLVPPSLRVGDDEEGRATWLELFFDLVFVVAVAQLSNTLARDATLHGFAVFAGLFVPVLWAWVGYTFYSTRFDTDDVVHRALVLLGMFAVAALAVNIPDAAHGGQAAFALSYVAVRLVAIALYCRAWLHVPASRPLVGAYVRSFSASVVLWCVSIATASPWVYWLWAGGLALDLVTPFVFRARQELAPVHPAHIPERMGLMTIIVLGESVLAVVVGTEKASWSFESGAVAFLGFVVAAAIWWLYFDYVDNPLSRPTTLPGQIYVYAHVPLFIGLTAFGVGVKLAIQDAPRGGLSDATTWILGGGLALAFAALAVIHLTTTRSRSDPDLWIRLATAVVALALGALGSELTPVAALGLVSLVVAGQLAYELASHDSHPAGA